MGLFKVRKSEATRFSNKFKAELQKLQQEAGFIYRGYTIAVFNFVLRETPQWTGNAVANWNYDIGAPTYQTADHFTQIWKGGDAPYSKLDPNKDALAYARIRAQSTVGSTNYSLFPDTFINNAAKDISGEKYIEYLEKNPGGYLRAVNDPGQMVSRARTSATGRFAHIDLKTGKSLATLTVSEDSAGIL